MDSCFSCSYAQNPTYLLFETTYWNVYLSEDQAYLGRTYVTLKQHKPKLSELSHDKWLDFIEIVKRIENTYMKAFSAEPLNWGCFMNNAFIHEPSNPHLHWHIYPRYKISQIVNAQEFKDDLYGYFYAKKATRTFALDPLS